MFNFICTFKTWMWMRCSIIREQINSLTHCWLCAFTVFSFNWPLGINAQMLPFTKNVPLRVCHQIMLNLQVVNKDEQKNWSIVRKNVVVIPSKNTTVCVCAYNLCTHVGTVCVWVCGHGRWSCYRRGRQKKSECVCRKYLQTDYCIKVDLVFEVWDLFIYFSSNSTM